MQDDDRLAGCEIEQGRERLRDAEELESNLISRRRARIPLQSLLPTESVMGPLRTGKRQRCARWVNRDWWFHLDLQALVV